MIAITDVSAFLKALLDQIEEGMKGNRCFTVRLRKVTLNGEVVDVTKLIEGQTTVNAPIKAGESIREESATVQQQTSADGLEQTVQRSGEKIYERTSTTDET